MMILLTLGHFDSITTASSVASSSGTSFVDASGYKFSEKDQRPRKIKVKKPATKNLKARAGKDTELSGEITLLIYYPHREMAFPSSRTPFFWGINANIY